jgi:predicted MFS family arabinose efflux permease
MNTKKAWLVAFAVILAGIALALVQNKVAPCMTTLMSAFDIDMAAAGWLSSLFSLIGIVMAIPASIILNKLGPKLGGIGALLCAIVGSLLGVFASGTTLLMISRVIEGIGVGLIAVIGPSLIAMWFPEAKRGLPMSIWGAYQMGAQAVMFFLGGVLTTNFGWQGMWWFALVACVLALVFYALCVKSPRAGQSFADVESKDISILEGMKSGSTWLISLSTMLFCVGCFGFINWIATCWVEGYGWSEGEANMWVGYFSIGGVIAAVIIGALLNKIRNRKAFGIIALVAYGVVSLVGMVMPDPTFIVVFVIVYPFVDASFPCVLWIMAAQSVKKSSLSGVALGVVCIGFNLGILLGPPVIGAIAEACGWQAGALAICIVCIMSAICLKFVTVYDQ